MLRAGSYFDHSPKYTPIFTPLFPNTVATPAPALTPFNTLSVSLLPCLHFTSLVLLVRILLYLFLAVSPHFFFLLVGD